MSRRRIKHCWTCCDACHAEHASMAAAWLHYLWLRMSRRA